MKDVAKFKKVTLSYSVKKKEVAKEALKEFYGSVLQIVFGPALLILGVVLNLFVDSVSRAFGNFIVLLGVIYIVLPIIILLFNLRKVKDSEVKMVLHEDKIVSFDDNNKYELYYGLLQDVKLDDKYITIVPIAVPKGKLKDILVPRYKIITNNEEEFVSVLKEKIDEKLSERAKIVCDYNISSDTRMRTILKYSASKDEIFNVMKSEYYGNKKNVYYAISLIVLSFIVFIQMQLLAVIFFALAAFYIAQPYIVFKRKLRGVENVNLQFDLCKEKRIGVYGENINKEMPLSFIKVISDEADFLKILIDIKDGGIYYIPKANITEGNVEEFTSKVTKIKKEGKRRPRL